MQDFPSPHNSKLATPAPDVVFVVESAADVPIWSGHDWISLERFIDDMDALGFSVWETPTAVYVYVGRID